MAVGYDVAELKEATSRKMFSTDTPGVLMGDGRRYEYGPNPRQDRDLAIRFVARLTL